MHSSTSDSEGDTKRTGASGFRKDKRAGQLSKINDTKINITYLWFK